MKRIIFILAILLGMGTMSGAVAQSVMPGVSINHFSMSRHDQFLIVAMDLDLNSLNVESNRAVLLTPRLVNGTDSVDLPSVGIYGHKRYYYYVRNGIGTISGTDEKAYRTSEKPDSMAYQSMVTYRDWMDGATLKFCRSDWGCCQEILAEYASPLGQHHESFFPELVFVQPKAESAKNRSLSGSAFIDFPVNKTVIYPDYRRNTVELGKIRATIDSVRNDKDISITSLWLKGYASPESPYAHNRELAIGRTSALKKYIGQLYHFAEGVIQTDYEAEDWAGLRCYVEQSDLEHRTEILQLIDSDMDLDAKEAKIKRAYPEEYRFLLRESYPALRHTDYRINYNIRTFSDVEEIKRIMAEQPQKLSLNEFYLVSGKYEPGTEEFTEVFKTAVRMFPNDEIANLNAANAAIRQDDFEMARKYLAKAGNSAEAVYARGALAVREKDYKTAVAFLQKAQSMGLEKAAVTLTELTKRGYVE